MRIFKNRGDIYISKVNKVKSGEQVFLYSMLVLIVIFTIAFLVYVGAKNDFSIKKFFEPENTTLSAEADVSTTEEMPSVTGKNSFVVIVHSDETLLWCDLLEFDMDSNSMTSCALRSTTKYKGKKLSEYYSQSDPQKVQKVIDKIFSIDTDYYCDFNEKEFEDFYNDLGDIDYTFGEDVKHRETYRKPNYTLRIRAGEQTVSASQFVNLMRYYLEEKKDTQCANELVLSVLTQQLNEENYNNADELFKTFIADATTNVSVRDYSSWTDDLYVLSSNESKATVYSANAEYSNNKITAESVADIKGYF